VIPAVPADEPHVAGILEREHAPTVVLLLVNPTFRVEGAGYLGCVHGSGSMVKPLVTEDVSSDDVCPSERTSVDHIGQESDDAYENWSEVVEILNPHQHVRTQRDAKVLYWCVVRM
jgi:hypothetical protein